MFVSGGGWLKEKKSFFIYLYFLLLQNLTPFQIQAKKNYKKTTQKLIKIRFLFCLRPEPPPPFTRFSESSDLSDNFELDIVPPCSPEYALEAVGGVEPELQQCPQESEIDSKFFVYYLFFL